MKHFSIRSYTKTSRCHFHQFHQLVFPLHGSINITLSEESWLVSQGECIIILAGQKHDFCAQQSARFIVVDCKTLPKNILNSTTAKITIDSALLSYIQFTEKQLAQAVNLTIEQQLFEVLFLLLSQQRCLNKVDKRLEKVLAVISDDLSQNFTIATLAQQAYLSPTQFKKIFKECLGLSVQSYISQQRMEKSKALLTHTDIPISIIAEQVGYQNPSAFSRKFKRYFGDNPKAFSH